MYRERQEEKQTKEEMKAGDGHTESGNGTEAAPALTFPLTGEAFVRLQAQAFRAVYVRWQFTERMSLFKIAASVFLCIIAAVNFSWGTAALAAAPATASETAAVPPHTITFFGLSLASCAEAWGESDAPSLMSTGALAMPATPAAVRASQ